MRHYIAYHKVEEWGPINENGPEFTHWSAKQKAYLEKVIGQNVWVIIGERDAGEMTYKLCHVFRPEKIVSSGAGYFVSGIGAGFVPHIDVTGENWLGKLLEEQNKFSYGLNEIKDGGIIDALLAFVESPPLAIFPDEIAQPQMYFAGATEAVVVNAYERDGSAHAACIAHYGARCLVCGFDFEVQYGDRGRGMIHMHHLKPLSEVKQGYQVDPIEDLRPVCPNCHTIIHKGGAQLSMAEARALVRVKYGKDR